MLPSYINYGRDDSQVAHHLVMGKDQHVGLMFFYYVVTNSTHAGKANLHWAFRNHAAC